MTKEDYTRHLRIKKVINEKLVIIETMKFCPDCDNIIFPTKDKKLYCKACEKEFDLETEADDFKIVKKIKHDEKELAPIVVKESMSGNKISAQDRKAFEEFFDAGGAESY
ncbi:MAG: hypothetical protein ACTSQU_00080 [Promethearchaeota archaeon]